MTFPMPAAPAAARTQRPHQDFDRFVVVDFEATCEKGTMIFPQEIIEFPALLVDAATGRLQSAFRTYVRPRHHPRLTDFCRELTGIRQSDVDGGVELADALRLHDEWLQQAAGAKNGGGCFAVVTWGNWDCKTMLESECRFKGIAKPPYFDRWINLRVPFEAAFGGDGRTKLQDAIAAAGLQWEGRLHCGLDDARNTALLLAELIQRGVALSITSSLAAPKPAKQQKKTEVHPQPQPVPRGGLVVATAQLGPCGGPAMATATATAMCCYCGVESRGGVVAMPGPMQGKCFYGCGNWTPAWGAMCPFFVWAA